MDAIINAGKTVIEGLSNNAGNISNIANAADSVANAVKNIKETAAPINNNVKKNNKLEEFKKKNKESLDKIAGEGFKVI